MDAAIALNRSLAASWCSVVPMMVMLNATGRTVLEIENLVAKIFGTQGPSMPMPSASKPSHRLVGRVGRVSRWLYFTLFQQTDPCRIAALQCQVAVSRGCEARPFDRWDRVFPIPENAL